MYLTNFDFFRTDKGREETAIAVYWVTDGMDRCRVGFLPRHCIRHAQDFDGKVAQVVEFLQHSDNKRARERSYRNCGMCMASIINCE